MQMRLYEKLSGKLAEAISLGALRAGDRLPSVRELSARERVSVSTVLQAYLHLEASGLIEARPQSGHYVRRPRALPPEPQPARPPPSATPVTVASLVARVYAAARDPRNVPLGTAVPAPELLPWRKLGRIVSDIARDGGGLHYELPPGSKALRRQLARRAIEWGCALSPDDFVITCGASEAVTLALLAVARRGDTIAIESPAYYGTLQAIEALGLKVVEIPGHPRDGLDLDALERTLEQRSLAAVLVVPNFSNPLGSLMPDEAKERLVAMLARRDIPLIEDDIYGDLHFGPARPRSTKSFDQKGLVLQCGSFSKNIAPGFRVGWIVPGKFHERIELLKFAQTVGTPTLQQEAIAEFLASGLYERHMRSLRRAMAAQVRAISDAIALHFPAGTCVTRPEGGAFVWVELPHGARALDLHARALAERIAIAPGPIFSARQGLESYVRIGCGHPFTARFEAAIVSLGRMVEPGRTARTG